jgi:hypothetical protein
MNNTIIAVFKGQYEGEAGFDVYFGLRADKKFLKVHVHRGIGNDVKIVNQIPPKIISLMPCQERDLWKQLPVGSEYLKQHLQH